MTRGVRFRLETTDMNEIDAPSSPRMSLRRRILRLAQAANRKTSWLDGLKNRLGITSLVLRMLAPPVKPQDAEGIVSSLNDRFIREKIDECRQKGLSPDFWILLVASMGDVVACEPIPRHLKELAPGGTVHWIVLDPFREILEANPFVDEIVSVGSLSEGKDLLASKTTAKEGAIAVDCHFDGTSCSRTNRIFPNPVNPGINIHTYYATGSLLVSFSSVAGLPRLDDAPVFHFSERGTLPPAVKPGIVVFHCHSSESCRDWTDDKWNDLADRIVKDGGTVLEVGTKRSLLPRPGFVDWTGRRSIQQIARIIESASLFVGIDSVFAHVANATRTRSLILLGKFRNFATYFPYSGEFARSSSFRIIRAPDGEPVRNLSVDAVFAAVRSMLGSANSHS